MEEMRAFSALVSDGDVFHAPLVSPLEYVRRRGTPRGMWPTRFRLALAETVGAPLLTATYACVFHSRLRFQVRRVTERLEVRLFSLLLVLVDIVLLIVRVGQQGWNLDGDDPPVSAQVHAMLGARRPSIFSAIPARCGLPFQAFESVSLAIIIYFVAELALRIFGAG